MNQPIDDVEIENMLREAHRLGEIDESIHGGTYHTKELTRRIQSLLTTARQEAKREMLKKIKAKVDTKGYLYGGLYYISLNDYEELKSETLPGEEGDE